MDLPNNLIKKLLTKKEEKNLQKRYHIIKLLDTDLTYREISRQMGISTTTVVRLNQRLGIRKNNKKLSFRPTAVERKINFSDIKNLKTVKEKKLPWVIG